MRQINMTVYTFDELSESAKSRAWMDYTANMSDFELDTDFRETLKKFEETFDCRVYRWCVDENCYSYQFSHCREGSFDCWLRFAKWVWNNYGEAIQSGKYYSKCIYQQGQRPRYIARRSRTTIEYTCNLTGFFADLDITKPIWDCIHYKQAYFNYDQLIDDCLDNFFSSWRDQMEYETSIEHFEELCEANGYEFTEYGEMWRD